MGNERVKQQAVGWVVYHYKMYIQAIKGKNNQGNVVALGAMTFNDALAMVSNTELELAA